MVPRQVRQPRVHRPALAIPKGHAAWKRGMAVFTIAKGGLMYEASIGGQKFSYTPLMD